MEQPKYKRVLLKISGEALAGDASRGLDFNVIGQVCEVIKECTQLGVQVGVVVGGGNFWRGLKDGGDRMERVRADHMGMLATSINALALADSELLWFTVEAPGEIAPTIRRYAAGQRSTPQGGYTRGLYFRAV